MKDPVKALEEARLNGGIPAGALLPSELIVIFGIHKDDRIDVFKNLRRMGLEAANPQGILRRYDPDQVAEYLKIFIDNGNEGVKPNPPQRLAGITYKSAPKKRDVRVRAKAEPGAEIDPKEEASSRPNADETKELISDLIDPDRLVTPAEAAEQLGRNVSQASVWINNLKRTHGLESQGKRGRSYIYRFSDIERAVKTSPRRKK